MSLYDNDDNVGRVSFPNFDGGQVALLLAETILHLLVEKNLLKTEDAVSALQTTADVRLTMAERDEEPSDATRAAIDALFQMMESFAVDLDPEARSRVRTRWETGRDL